MADPLFVKRYVELLKNKKVKAAGILVFEARNKKAHSPLGGCKPDLKDK